MRTLQIIRVEGPVPWAAGFARQQAEAAELLDATAPRAKLILLQHAPVYTLGRMTKREHLLGLAMPAHMASTTPPPLVSLPRQGGGAAPEIVEIDRGGSVTYHGPGQLTAYLLLNLKRWGCSIHQHLWNLEEIAIHALASFGREGKRIEGMTGVWCAQQAARGAVHTDADANAKICAVGVATRRWITYHGIGLNVDLDLTLFERIDPCGLGRKPVTSLAKLLGRPVPIPEAEAAVVRATAEVLNARIS